MPTKKSTNNAANKSPAASPEAKNISAPPKTIPPPQPNLSPAPAAPPARAPAPSAPVVPLPRCTLAEAMNEIGLDTRKLAGVLNSQVDRLQGDPPQEKLLLESVKECAKLLEPPQRAGAPDQAPLDIVHYIPRPDRSASPSAAPRGPSADPYSSGEDAYHSGANAFASGEDPLDAASDAFSSSSNSYNCSSDSGAAFASEAFAGASDFSPEST